MTQIDLDSIKTPKMSSDKHKHRTFRLLCIQGINATAGNNFYKVLFQDIDSGIYLTEDIFPEFLHGHYAIGQHYKDTKLVKSIPPLGEIHPITIEATDNNHIVKISDVLSDDEYKLNQWFRTMNGYFDFSKYNKNQRCVVFEDDYQLIIFPCAVIGACYYFTSSSMRRQIFSMKLDGLYEDIKLDRKKRTAFVHLKPGASKSDAPHIVRFKENPFAYARWLAVHKSLLAMKKNMELQGDLSNIVPLEIDFPIWQTIHMQIRGLWLQDTALRKDKVLVFEILDDDSQFDFDTISFPKKTNPDKQQNSDGNVVVIKKRATKKQLNDKKPTSRLSPISIKPSTKITNTHILRMKIIDGTVEGKQPTVKNEVLPIIRLMGPAVEISVIGQGTDGASDTRPASMESQENDQRENELDKDVSDKQTEPNNGSREDFYIADFFYMTGFLNEHADVHNFEMSLIRDIPLKKTRKARGLLSLKESYNKSHDSRRTFVTTIFNYSGKNICLVEIDHTGLPNGPGTYLLFADEQLPHPQKHAMMVVKRFVDEVQHEDTINDLKEIGITFDTKIHPSSKEDNFYVRWCEELLRRISDKNCI